MDKWASEWLSKWMNAWMSAWMNEWMNEWVNECVNKWMHKWVIECMNRRDWMNEYQYLLTCPRAQCFVSVSPSSSSWKSHLKKIKRIWDLLNYVLQQNSQEIHRKAEKILNLPWYQFKFQIQRENVNFQRRKVIISTRIPGGST